MARTSNTGPRTERHTEAVRNVLERFDQDGRVYFKVNRVANLTGKSTNKVVHGLRDLEEQGAITRWNPEANGAIVWQITDIDAGREVTDE